jgi:hypothetical protein
MQVQQHTDSTLPSTTTHARASTNVRSDSSTPLLLTTGFTVACTPGPRAATTQQTSTLGFRPASPRPLGHLLLITTVTPLLDGLTSRHQQLMCRIQRTGGAGAWVHRKRLAMIWASAAHYHEFLLRFHMGSSKLFFVDFLFINFGCNFSTISLRLLVLLYVRRNLDHGLIHYHQSFLISVSQNFPIF